METLAQVFSCEFCEISKNTLFLEHILAAATDNWKKRLYDIDANRKTSHMTLFLFLF